jgi:hypothetical protein
MHFKPRMPLVRVPRMFLQHCSYLLDGWRVLLLKDLISDDRREHVAGDVARGSGWYVQTDCCEARE